MGRYVCSDLLEVWTWTFVDRAKRRMYRICIIVNLYREGLLAGFFRVHWRHDESYKILHMDYDGVLCLCGGKESSRVGDLQDHERQRLIDLLNLDTLPRRSKGFFA